MPLIGDSLSERLFSRLGQACRSCFGRRFGRRVGWWDDGLGLEGAMWVARFFGNLVGKGLGPVARPFLLRRNLS